MPPARFHGVEEDRDRVVGERAEAGGLLAVLGLEIGDELRAIGVA